MLRHFIVSTYYFAKKHPLQNLVNISGFSLGLAIVFSILAYITYLLSFDNYYSQGNRIVRVVYNYTNLHKEASVIAHGIAPLLKANLPEVEDYSRIHIRRSLLRTEQAEFFEDNLAFADASAVDLFDMKFIIGNPFSSLQTPNNALLTKTTAQKYFPNEVAVGKQIFLDNRLLLTVVGIIEDLPKNSHLRANIWISMPTIEQLYSTKYFENYLAGDFHTYLLLRPNIQHATAENKINVLIQNKLGVFAKESGLKVFVQNLTDIHLRPGVIGDTFPTQHPYALFMLAGLAGLVLSIATINFINLNIAIAHRRGKEIALRKIFGSSQYQFIKQSFTETALYLVAATISASIILWMVLPWLNELMADRLELNYFIAPRFLLIILGILISTAMIAGFYPARQFVRYQPNQVLKSEITQGKKSLRFRHSLMIIQFAMGSSMLFSSWTMWQQIKFIQSTELHYQKDDIWVIPHAPMKTLHDIYIYLSQELVQDSVVTSITHSERYPTQTIDNHLYARTTDTEKQSVTMLPYLLVGYDFFSTYAIPLLSGRSFDRNYGKDNSVFPNAQTPHTKNAVIINRQALQIGKWNSPEQALGQWIELGFDVEFNRKIYAQIIGVVEDIHFSSLHEAIRPTVYLLSHTFDAYKTVSLRLPPHGSATKTIQHIQHIWQKWLPDYPFEGFYLSIQSQALYHTEHQLMRILITLTSLGLLLTVLGLAAIVAINIQQRSKEIAIRRVLGASSGSIIYLFSTTYLKCVTMAQCIAWPIAYISMSKWLNNFAYHIEFPWSNLLLCFAASACLTYTIVVCMCFSATTTRPHRILKDE